MRRSTSLRVALAAATGAGAAFAASRPTLVPWPGRIRPAFVGTVAGAGVAVAWGASSFASGLTSGRPMADRARRLALLAGLGVGASGAGRLALVRLRGSLAQGGRDLDPGLAQPPDDPYVTGGPGSLVPYATLGREGARWVSDRVDAAVIEAVTGSGPVAESARVFVGIDSAALVEERVALAIDELHRTGAFDRAHLLVESPAGSGFANPTPVDVLEILTRGDCAAVSIGYGTLPSFLSLDRVALAAKTQLLLLERIRDELANRSTRPRLLLYGESLGARVQQAAIPAGSADLDRFGIDAALWVGTPGGPASVAFHAAVAGESFTLDRPEQIPRPVPQPRPRVWFLEHDGDPVVRFEPTVAYRRPPWLATRPRGRNVPDDMVWVPGITWSQVLVDTLFATNVKPGNFESRGHDYRADLGATVAAAFDLSTDAGTAQRLEDALREREIARATRIGEA